MRRLLLLAFPVLATAGAVGDAAGSAGAPPFVSPTAGHPRTTFTVSFYAPQSTGASGSTQISYIVSASRSSRESHCTSSRSVSVTHASGGSRVRVKLKPDRRWCIGRFHGSVVELIRESCPPLEVCPAFALPEHQLGTFAFRVKRARR